MFSGHVIYLYSYYAQTICSNILSLDSSSDYFKMGKITLEMLAKSPSHTKKRKDETVQQYVRRLTHLYFSEKNIDEIVSRYVISVKFHRLFDSGSIGNLVVCIPVHFGHYASCYSHSKLLLCIAVAEQGYKLLSELTTQQYAP